MWIIWSEARRQVTPNSFVRSLRWLVLHWLAGITSSLKNASRSNICSYCLVAQQSCLPTYNHIASVCSTSSGDQPSESIFPEEPITCQSSGES